MKTLTLSLTTMVTVQSKRMVKVNGVRSSSSSSDSSVVRSSSEQAQSVTVCCALSNEQ
jgi:hypothetical protein